MKLTEKEDGIHKLRENPVTYERPGIIVSEVTDASRKKHLQNLTMFNFKWK